MATYSLSITAIRADSAFVNKPLTLPDTSARLGGMQLAMRNGTQLLCKGPDGATKWYTLDTQRSTPDNPVLLAV